MLRDPISSVPFTFYWVTTQKLPLRAKLRSCLERLEWEMKDLTGDSQSLSNEQKIVENEWKTSKFDLNCL